MVVSSINSLIHFVCGKRKSGFRSLFLVFVLHISCNSNEEFVSSTDGKILSGVIVRPDVIGVIRSNEDHCYFELDIHNKSFCPGIDFCDNYLGDLNSNLGEGVTRVIYQLVSDERITNPINELTTRSDPEMNSELMDLQRRFNSQFESIDKHGFTGFSDDDYLSLINQTDAFYSNFSVVDRLRLWYMRKLAVEWREKRAFDMEQYVMKERECNVAAGTYQISVDVKYVDELCSPNISYCNCLEQAQNLLDQWPRDYMLAQIDFFGNPLLRHQYSSDNLLAKNLMVRQVAHQLGIKWMKNSKLTLEGGNVIASKDLLFIGKNVLHENYLAEDNEVTTENLVELGLDPSADRDSMTVSDKIEEVVNKQVVWVGLDRKVPDLLDSNKGETHQPIFHIDMFMMVYEYRKSTVDSSELTYILAVPDSGGAVWTDIEQYCDDVDTYERLASLTDSLSKWIKESACLMEDDLRKKRIKVNRVSIPLPVRWKCESYIEGTYSFTNGLVETLNNEQIFYLPKYCLWSQDKAALEFKKAISILRDSNDLNVKVINGGFFETKRGALHCEFVVTNRENQ